MLLTKRTGFFFADGLPLYKEIVRCIDKKKLLQYNIVNCKQQKRGIKSLSVIKVGGGRSSVSGIIATVFGATGFLGRYVVNNLGRTGSQVIIPFRYDEHNYRHLKLMGDLGTIVPFRFDIRDIESVKTAISRSNVVINLIGRNYETKYFSFEDVNVKIPKMLAQLSSDMGIERFIHFSCLGAKEDSPFRFYKTKAEGEKAVLQAFPRATIFRPAPIYGHFDHFLNKIAYTAQTLSFIPVLNEGQSQIQPIYVLDVATAVMNAIVDDMTAGKTYSLGGNKIYTMMEIVNMIYTSTQRKNITVHFGYPGIIAKLAWPFFKQIFDLMKMNYVVPANSLSMESLHMKKNSRFRRNS